MSHLDGVQGLGEGTNLVHLDEDTVTGTHLDTLLQVLHVGYEEVVTNQLAFVADGLGELHPAFPVFLGQTVLDGVDGVFGDELLEVVDLLVRGELAAARIFLLAVLELLVIVEELTVLLEAELGSCAVHGDGNILTRNITGTFDGGDDAIQGVVDALQGGSETTFVTYGGAQATAFEHFLQGVEYLGAHADGLGLVLGADRTDHELLESDRSIGVSTTVNDVHHGNRENISVGAAQVAVQGHAQLCGSSLGNGQGNAQDGVGAQLALGRRTVQFDHGFVDGALLRGIHADDFRSNHLVHVVNSFQDTLAAIALFVAVAELKSLVFTGGSAGRNGSNTNKTGIQGNFNFDGRISAGIQDFSTENLYDLHSFYRINVVVCAFELTNVLNIPIIYNFCIFVHHSFEA